MIISTSLKFRFAEGELVVISSLASEPMKDCKASPFEKLQLFDDVTRVESDCDLKQMKHV